jgi:hypothetical protein
MGYQEWRRGVFRVAGMLNRRPTVAHQGIQRSGTNYLSGLLDQAGFFVLNRVDPPRSDPRHKHFRWQQDKSTIVMHPAYRNDIQAASVLEANAICGWSRDEKHVVIFKEPTSWLSSIYRWGLTHGWIENEADFLGDPLLAHGWLREWDAYYGHWYALHRDAPSQVFVICYEDLIQDPEDRIGEIASFLGRQTKVRLRDGGRITKVRHSSTRASRIAETPRLDGERVAELVSRAVTVDWQGLRR